jgi:DNA ligase (NAD+)
MYEYEGKTMKKTVEFPAICPSCGCPVHLDDQKVNLWCDNPTCPAQLERRVLHWIKTLDVMGVGSVSAEQLCRQGFVKDVPDLYFLTEEQLMAVTGGKSSAQKAQRAILEKSEVPLAVFLDALGIDGLGTTSSKAVAKEFKTLAKVRQTSIVEFDALPDIGETTARNIVDGLEKLSGMIDRLSSVLDIIDVKDVSGPLKGMSFLITGTLSVGRKEMESLIEANGGVMVSSVGKKLNHLIVGDAPGSKLEKAKKLGVAILSEDELRNMIG